MIEVKLVPLKIVNKNNKSHIVYVLIRRPYEERHFELIYEKEDDFDKTVDFLDSLASNSK